MNTFLNVAMSAVILCSFDAIAQESAQLCPDGRAVILEDSRILKSATGIGNSANDCFFNLIREAANFCPLQHMFDGFVVGSPQDGPFVEEHIYSDGSVSFFCEASIACRRYSCRSAAVKPDLTESEILPLQIPPYWRERIYPPAILPPFKY